MVRLGAGRTDEMGFVQDDSSNLGTFGVSGNLRHDAKKKIIITGTETFLSIAIPFRTSERATSCGVETMTAPIDHG